MIPFWWSGFLLLCLKRRREEGADHHRQGAPCDAEQGAANERHHRIGYEDRCQHDEQRDAARNGEIVVALVSNEEVTLKRIEQKQGEVVLHPANASMEAMRYSADEVQIQGVLKGLLRSYS